MFIRLRLKVLPIWATTTIPDMGQSGYVCKYKGLLTPAPGLLFAIPILSVSNPLTPAAKVDFEVVILIGKSFS